MTAAGSGPRRGSLLWIPGDRKAPGPARAHPGFPGPDLVRYRLDLADAGGRCLELGYDLGGLVEPAG
jgi:hypothetical protein